MRAIMSLSGSLIIISRSPLPAGLGHAGHLAQRSEFAQRDTAHLELAVVGARTARDLAAVADAHRGGVARQLGELEAGLETLLQRLGLIVGDGLQRITLLGVLGDE